MKSQISTGKVQDIQKIRREKEKREKQKRKAAGPKGKLNIALILIIILTVAFGIIMVYSASYNYCINKNLPPYKLALKQAIFAVGGIAIMLFVARFINYQIFTRISGLAWTLYIVSIIMSIAVMFIGVKANGARRWLELGPVQLQPSELLKVAVVLVLANFIHKHGSEFNIIKHKLQAWSIVLAPAAIVIICCSNLSSGLIILGIGAVIIGSTSKNFWKIGLIVFIVGGLAVFGIIGIAKITPAGKTPNIPIVNIVLKGYRLDRIRAWINPFEDKTGYQAVQSLYAIGSGGVFGKGLSNGIQKLGFLPEPYNDIIFAVICEELGLVGSILLLLIYCIIVGIGLIGITMQTKNMDGQMLALGITSMIGLQALANAAVTLGIIPTTGMQLPLISYGGTGLVVVLGALGLLLNVSYQNSLEKAKAK